MAASISGKKSILHSSAFNVLQVSTLDSRSTIIAQADERSLHVDPDACQKARADLTNPRTRLIEELGWLPGLSPNESSTIMSALEQNPIGVAMQKGRSDLARANLLAAAIQLTDADDLLASAFADLMRTLGERVDVLDASTVLADVNKDRAAAGFQEVRDLSALSSELDARHRIYKNLLQGKLDEMPSLKLVETMTLLVERATKSGSKAAPAVIDDLAEGYALETFEFLERERANIRTIISNVEKVAPTGAWSVKPLLDVLATAIRSWHRITQPIKVSRMARGMSHAPTNELGFELRAMYSKLFRDHNMVDESQRVIALLTEFFSEDVEIAQKAAEDSAVIVDIQKKRASQAERITFKTEVGLIMKDELSISPAGIVWKGRSYSLESVSRVRWGAITRSINGIPTGTDYSIAFTANQRDETISIRKEATYSGFIAALWPAVCGRLLVQMAKDLKEGGQFRFGNITVSDNFVVLQRPKFFGTEAVRLGWDDIKIYSANGSMHLLSVSNSKVRGASAYMTDWNTHIVDALIKASFKHGVKNGLSEYWLA